MNLEVVLDSSPNQFLENAGPLLYQDEPMNSLIIGLCGNLLRAKESPKTSPVLIRIVNGDETVAAAIQTPPMNLVITYANEEQLTILAKHLFETGVNFPGVVGPTKASETFASIWSKLSGIKATLGMGQKIYKVETVILPPTKGILRVAEPQEAELIAQWLAEFGNESLPPPDRKSVEERKPHAVRAIENKLAYVWVADGAAVSMAHIGRPTENGISISAVYTPKHLRKRGYASAVVAHLSRKMLGSGNKFCVLYTDLSNPTSNKIYQDVGYREVSDSKHFLFEEQPEKHPDQV